MIVHSGDFKLDFTPFNGEMTDLTRFAELGKQGVVCFMSDSTNIEKEGYTISERDIALELENIFHRCDGRILVTLFASNIQRIQQIFEIAERFGRKVLFNGRSIVASVRLARELGVVRFEDSQLIDVGQLAGIPRDKVVIMCTGSQGEPMSVLSRIADDNHRHINVEEGDTVILSSKIIPGNERAVTSVINELYRKGAEVVYETIGRIHTSGHAHREELKVLLRLVRPEHFVPIHGEYRHLVQHARLAAAMGVQSENAHVLEDGQVLALADERAWIDGTVPSGRVYVDGHGVGDVGQHRVGRTRRILSEDGTITCALAHRDGVVVSGPLFQEQGAGLRARIPRVVRRGQSAGVGSIGRNETRAGVRRRPHARRNGPRRAPFVQQAHRTPADRHPRAHGGVGPPCPSASRTRRPAKPPKSPAC